MPLERLHQMNAIGTWFLHKVGLSWLLSFWYSFGQPPYQDEMSNPNKRLHNTRFGNTTLSMLRRTSLLQATLRLCLQWT